MNNNLSWYLLLLLFMLFPIKTVASEESHLVIQLPWDHQFQFAGFYQALWQGYYHDAGIKVTIRSGISKEGNVIDAIGAISNGEADIAPVDGLSLLIAQDNGANIVALKPILQRTPWVFHSLSDIPLNNLSDLASAPIATSPDSVLIYKLLLQRGKIKPDLNLIISEPPIIDSLINDTAKIVSDYADGTAWQARQMNLRVNTLYAEDYGINFYADVVAVNRNRLKANPTVIEKFLEATFRGWEYVLSNKEATIRKIVEELPRDLPFDDLTGFNRHLAARYQQLLQYPQVALGENDPKRWQYMHQSLKEIGAVSGDLDLGHQIYAFSSIDDGNNDWLLITLLFSSLVAVTVLTGWSGLHRLGYLSPLVSVIFILFIMLLTIALYREYEIENQKQETLLKLSQIRVQLEESINSTIFLMKGLVVHIRLNPTITQTEFEIVTQQLVDGHPMIRNIAAAPDFIIRMVYPLEGNQQIIDLDYRQLPDQFPVVLKVKELDQVVLAGPLELVQGDIALIGRLPVYIKNQSGQRKFWGIVSIVINADILYRMAGLYDSSMGLEFAVRGKDGMGKKGNFFFGDEQLFDDKQSVMMNVVIPGGVWQVAARSTNAWHVSIKLLLFVCLFGFASIILTILSYHIRLAHEKQRSSNEQYISYLAYHDILTGLPNRAQFMKELDRELAYAQRTGKIIVLMMLDLDYFKQINDTLGHDAGDKLLKVAAQRLKKRVRKSDHVARLGGDEFAIILRDIETTENVMLLGQQLLGALSEPYDIKQTKFQSGASIGIAVWQPGQSGHVNLLEQADMALYKAKDKGRGCFTFHTNKMTRDIQRRVDLRNDLEQALNTDALFLVYQPQIDISNDRLIGVEALLRWRHPQHGFVSPAEFIPIAEMHGMMHRLGLRILTEACETLSRWRNQNLATGVMAVNISPNQLDSQDFSRNLIDLMERLNLPGEILELEMTERIMVKSQTGNARMFHELAAKRIKFSMDDFGTGYSSLLTLKRWPFYRLKIAQEFVRDMLTDQNDREIVKATIGLAENLGLQVIAEGVEKIEQLEFLKQNGCYLIQGYLLARPMPEAQLLEWIRDRNTSHF